MIGRPAIRQIRVEVDRVAEAAFHVAEIGGLAREREHAFPGAECRLYRKELTQRLPQHIRRRGACSL